MCTLAFHAAAAKLKGKLAVWCTVAKMVSTSSKCSIVSLQLVPLTPFFTHSPVLFCHLPKMLQQRIVLWRVWVSLECVLCRSTSEVAGIGVESSLLRFARQHFQGALALPLVGGTSLFLQANAAAMLPWGPGWQQKPTCISDRSVLRFHLKHPTTAPHHPHTASQSLLDASILPESLPTPCSAKHSLYCRNSSAID